MLSKAWNQFSVEKEGREVDDEAVEEEDGCLRGDEADEADGADEKEDWGLRGESQNWMGNEPKINLNKDFYMFFGFVLYFNKS